MSCYLISGCHRNRGWSDAYNKSSIVFYYSVLLKNKKRLSAAADKRFFIQVCSAHDKKTKKSVKAKA